MIFHFLLPLLLRGQECLVGCRDQVGDGPMFSSAIETLLTAGKEGFYIDFNEACVISNPTALVNTDPLSDGFYEFLVERVSPPIPARPYHGECGSGPFDYLNSGISGAIKDGDYTYKCESTDFYPDDSFTALPHSRAQPCMYGLRLVAAHPDSFGAAFWNRKQKVSYGFDTTFKFKVLQNSVHCGLEQSSNAGKWCYPRGGRGFAFVIQNQASPGVNGVGDVLSGQIGSLGTTNFGYAFPRNLAIEFDYFYDADSNDPNWNHISVMVPVVKRPGDTGASNSADHDAHAIASTTCVNLPPLSQGLHTVRISYTFPGRDDWQTLMTEFQLPPLSSDQRDMMSYWSRNHPGLLTVFLNDKPVLKTLIDISLVVDADPVSTYAFPAIDAPNVASPGSAWVGFVAATGSSSVSSPLIADWRWTSSPQCAGDAGAPITCAVGRVKADTQTTQTKFTLRNIGTTDLHVMTTLGDESRMCTNAQLNWNQVHPYFLGCERQVAVGAGLTSITVTDLLGVRSVQIAAPDIVDRDYTGAVFLRRQVPAYCVIEHESDAYRLYFAQCDCEFCARVFNNQLLYSVFFSNLCSERYSFSCSCFEVSQMSADTYATDYAHSANPWKRILRLDGYNEKNMQFQRHSVCRGCKFDDHCSHLNKAGVCDTPATVYRVGIPLKPEIGGAFLGWDRGTGNADGTIKGSACDCGDRVSEPPYLTALGTEQLFDVYLKTLIQGSYSDCASCLRLPGSNCVATCGSPQYSSYLHHPAGQSCATCMLASASWLDLAGSRRAALRACVYAAIEAGGDPWESCVDTVNVWVQATAAEAKAKLANYLNGVHTHFLTECPGKPVATFGAVCVPNLVANELIPMQVLARGPAQASVDGTNFPLWWNGVACMNAQCRLQPQTECYQKLLKIVFTENQTTGQVECSDALHASVPCFLEGSPTFDATSGAVIMDKMASQYGHTGVLNRGTWTTDPALEAMRRKTLEAWVKVAPVDRIADLNLDTAHTAITASSSWGQDYEPSLAVDGDASTFWQSKTSIIANFAASWEIQFGTNVQHAQGFTILWKFPASTFTVQIATGSAPWEIVESVSGNSALTSMSTKSFKFTKLKIQMATALQARPAGQDNGRFAYGIREFVVDLDFTASRLKPIEVVQTRAYLPSAALDGDLSTWWSTPVGTGSGSLSFTTPTTVTNVALIRVVFRRGFSPADLLVEQVVAAGGFAPIQCTRIGCDTFADASYLNSYSQIHEAAINDVSSFRVTVAAGSGYYGSEIVQLAEIQVFSSGDQAVVFTPSVCRIAAASCPTISSGTGSVAAGATASFESWTASSSLPAGHKLGIFTLTFEDANSLPWSISIFSPSNTAILTSWTDVQQSNVFSVLVNDVADLSVRIVAKATQATVITVFQLTPIVQLDLSASVAVSASSAWSETFAIGAPVQGMIANINDGNYATDFRPKLGAPVLVGSASVDPDYVVSIALAAHTTVDHMYIHYSFASEWFRVEPVAVAGEAGSCEWTPDLRPGAALATSGCDAMEISTENYYRFAVDSSRVAYVSAVRLTLMQASAMNSLRGLAVLGVSEVEMFSALNRSIPQCVSVDTVALTDAVAMSDKNFDTELTIAGQEIVLNLGSAKYVEEVQIWWGLDADLPSSVAISVSADCSTKLWEFTYTPTDKSVPLMYNPVTNLAVQCISLETPVGVTVAEIVVLQKVPSYNAAILASTLTNTGNALGSSPSTSATAVAANAGGGGSEHHVMLRLDVAVGTPVWGVSMDLTEAAGFAIAEPDGLVLYVCASSDAVADCKARDLKSVIPTDKRTDYKIGPSLSCLSCDSVLLVVTGALTSGTDMFSLASLKVFASENVALSAVASFADDRTWNADVGKANDGDVETLFISELDVTSADITVSLIPEGSIALAPQQLSGLTVSFLWPVEAFSVFKSDDGNVWSAYKTVTDNSLLSLELTDAFEANFVRIRLLKTLITTSVSGSSAAWSSPGFAVKEVAVVRLRNMQTNRAVTVSSTAASGNYGLNSGVWISYPPSASATLSFGSSMPICGVSLDWLFTPSSYQLVFSNGATRASTEMFADGSTRTTLTGVAAATSVRLSLSAFSNRRGVDMAALNAVTVFTVGATQTVATVSAPTPSDDSDDYLTNGDFTSAYTSPPITAGVWAGGPVTMTFTFTTPVLLGKTTISWNKVCSEFSVAGVLGNGQVVTFYETTTNSALVTDVYFLLTVSELRVTAVKNHDGTTVQFSVLEVQFWQAAQIAVTASDVTVSDFSAANAVDSSNGTMWMATPGSTTASLTIDLGAVYKVKAASVLWGWAPFESGLAQSLINSARGISVSSDGTAFTSIQAYTNFNSGGHVDVAVGRLVFRYLRITTSGAYVDGDLDPSSSLFGVSIRNIEVFLDDNLMRDGEGLVVRATGGWWDFPSSATGDADEGTLWLSKRGESTAALISNLGTEFSVAGVAVNFNTYIAGNVTFYRSTDCVSYVPVHTVSLNTAAAVTLPGQDYQFRALCVQVELAMPVTQIQNPDASATDMQAIFGVTSFSVFRQVGGGGVFGIESNSGGQWGSVFDTIAFSPFQPRQWNLLSNQQDRTMNVNAATLAADDISEEFEHIVATFSDTTVKLYRNGQPFGSSYATTTIPWDMADDVRLVFGVRSSGFVNSSPGDQETLMGSSLPGKQTTTLNPFFSGQIKSVALFSRDLSPEEVLGLYEAGADPSLERGCHCYDACPTGMNRHSATVPVPCSGQGVCKRQYTNGLPAPGLCECNPGFSGDNCSLHCSQIGGCCSLDDDCPNGKVCDATSSSCTSPPAHR